MRWGPDPPGTLTGNTLTWSGLPGTYFGIQNVVLRNIKAYYLILFLHIYTYSNCVCVCFCFLLLFCFMLFSPLLSPQLSFFTRGKFCFLVISSSRAGGTLTNFRDHSMCIFDSLVNFLLKCLTFRGQKHLA